MFNTKDYEILEKINEDTFIVSDTHFFHKNILEFEPCRMTGMNIDGHIYHDEWLVDNWNSTVKPNDVVLHMGDFAFKGIRELENKLNGYKILILGNHDRKGSQVYNNVFDYVIRGLYVEAGIDNPHYLKAESNDELFSAVIKNINNKRVMFSHYPVDETEIDYDRSGRITKRIETCINLYYEYGCELNVHGHTHSNKMQDRDTRKFINACVEHTGFKPKKLKELLK